MPGPDRDASLRPRVALLVALGVAVLATGLAGAGRWGGGRWQGGGGALAPREIEQPTAPATASPPPFKIPPAHAGSSTMAEILKIVLLVVAVLLVAILVVVIVRWWRGRPGRVPRGDLAAPRGVVGDEEDASPDVQKVRRGFDRAFQVLDEDRPPSDAIVAAWMGLEEAAQDAGVVRRPAETPAELTRRILRLLAVDHDASETLLDLYERVRFGGRETTAQDVATARACLETMTAGWRRAGSDA